jgi:D-methionine transport system substrate-binding protein
MKTHFQHLRVLFLAAVTAFAVQSGWAATLKIGVVPGAYADSVKAAAKEAKKRGIDVQVIEFTDWTTPNVALNSGDLDANYFQHQPFLDNSIAKQGYKLKSVGTGILSNFGLYSLKHKTLAEFPSAARSASPTTRSTRAAVCCCCRRRVCCNSSRAWATWVRSRTSRPTRRS